MRRKSSVPSSNGALPSHSGPSVRTHALGAEHRVQVRDEEHRRERRRRRGAGRACDTPRPASRARRRVGGACAVPRNAIAPSGVSALRGERGELRRRRRVEAHRLAEADVDLGLGQRVGRRRHDRRPHLHVDLRDAARKDRGLPLLVADRRRQHVVGEPRRLGHRRVDHDQQIELLARLAPARGVRVREDRIRALDDDGANALGMVDQDLLGHERRREHAAVAERADRRDARGERALGLARIACGSGIGGRNDSRNMQPPGRPRLSVSTSRTRMRYETRVENGVCSTPRS